MSPFDFTRLDRTRAAPYLIYGVMPLTTRVTFRCALRASLTPKIVPAHRRLPYRPLFDGGKRPQASSWLGSRATPNQIDQVDEVRSFRQKSGRAQFNRSLDVARVI